MSARDLRRILVALDASPHSHAALEEAAAMAALLEAELTGLFVLDTDLLRLAELPAAHETGLTSAQRRALDPESMERSLKLQADRARQALESIARTHRLQSSFRLSRGNVLRELQKAAAEADLIALGLLGQTGAHLRKMGSTTRGLAAQASCSLLILVPGMRPGDSIAVVFSDSEDSRKALDLGLELAAHQEAELAVLLCGDSDALPDLRAEADARLEDSAATATVVQAGAECFEDLQQLLRDHDAGLLVIGRDCELLTEREEELGELNCPVLLARAR